MKVSKFIVPMVALTVTNSYINTNNQVVAVDCERVYADWCDKCRLLPQNAKVERALCWSAAMTAYAACLAGRAYTGA